MVEQIRVLFSCSGIGIFNRGIETFFREAFDGLKNLNDVETLLIKGGGLVTPCEHVVWNLPRTKWLAAYIGRITRRSAYAVEQWSSFPGVVREIRRYRPHIVFFSDANLGFLLYRFRKQIGVPFKLLFSNGGPCHPPFDRVDFVQQVAPLYYEDAMSAGEPQTKHFFVPYGIRVPQTPFLDALGKMSLRARLRLPVNRLIVLSVGWISKVHKRMDYVINEVAQLPVPRPFLMLVGAIDGASADVIHLASRLLGPDGFCARSVKPEEVADYYQAADIFALGSLAEGFGRVYLEALLYGLPVLADRNPVTTFVLGEAGTLCDLRCRGALANLIEKQSNAPSTKSQMEQRRSFVSGRFSWDALREQYRQMFWACVSQRE